MTRLVSITVASALIGLWTPTFALAEADGCDADLCLAEGGGGKWRPDTRMSKKEKRKYRRRRGESSTLSLTIDDGRGTVFLDGRFLGVAPLESVEITPGAHDLQVRDGSTVLAQGVLVAPRKGGELDATVGG